MGGYRQSEGNVCTARGHSWQSEGNACTARGHSGHSRGGLGNRNPNLNAEPDSVQARVVWKIRVGALKDRCKDMREGQMVLLSNLEACF